MAKRTNNKNGGTNKDKLLISLTHRGICPKDKGDQTLEELIAEGHMLLAEVKGPAKIWHDPEKVTVPTKHNPYKEAYDRVLAMMDDEKRNLIFKLKKEGKTDSYIYLDFIKTVCKLGDELSNK